MHKTPPLPTIHFTACTCHECHPGPLLALAQLVGLRKRPKQYTRISDAARDFRR